MKKHFIKQIAFFLFDKVIFKEPFYRKSKITTF